MKRKLGWALLISAALVWGLPHVNADPVEGALDGYVHTREDGRLAVSQENLTRTLARAALNTTASAGGNTSFTSPQGPEAAPAARSSMAEGGRPIYLGEEAESKALLVAGAGAAVGLGVAAYYWGAIAGFLAPFFSRIDKDKLLENDVRSRVFDAIEHNPGITIKEVTEVCNIGWGTAVYHLKRLEGEKLVVSQRHRQFRRFFKNGGGIVNAEKTAYAELKSETGQALAKAVLENPGSVQKDLCEVLGISAPLAHKYLSRLEEASLIRREKEWKFVRYFPTERLGTMFPAPLALTV